MAEPVADVIQDALTFRTTQLQRLAVSEVRQVNGLLRQLEDDLLRQLQRRDLDPTAPLRTVFQRQRLEKLLAETQARVRQTYAEIARQERGTLIAVAQAEQGAVAGAVNAAIGVDLLSPSLDLGQLRALVDNTFISGGASHAATIKDWWRKQAADMQTRFAGTVRQGMLQGETVGQLVRRVRGTAAARYQDGLMAISRRNAETLVRTAVMGVHNTARLEMIQAHPEVMQGARAVVTLDMRTSHLCISRSGAAWNLTTGQPLPWSTRKEPFPGAPPWHFNCRSTLSPVTRAYSDMLGRLGGAGKREVAQLPADQKEALSLRGRPYENYDHWLARQPAATQIQVLGPARRKLWQAGTVSLQDLIDQRGRPLTLAQLSAS